jgi:hypothetical protein
MWLSLCGSEERLGESKKGLTAILAENHFPIINYSIGGFL